MFEGMTIEERREFLAKTYDNFIPGYTGYCPSLKFQYGRGYGTNTREILKDLRTKKIFHGVQEERYPSQDYKIPVLAPVLATKDYTVDFKHWSPKYITGYTGFIPTINFRYGKSYSRAVNDCSYDYDTDKLRRIQMAHEEANNMFRAQSTPRMKSIRSQDEVKRALNEYLQSGLFQDHKISPDYPPIAGYTGHIPGVKGNEQSLSERYNTVVKRGLTLLQNEREKMRSLKNAQNQLVGVLQDFENLHNTVKV